MKIYHNYDNKISNHIYIEEDILLILNKISPVKFMLTTNIQSLTDDINYNLCNNLSTVNILTTNSSRNHRTSLPAFIAGHPGFPENAIVVINPEQYEKFKNAIGSDYDVEYVGINEFIYGNLDKLNKITSKHNKFDTYDLRDSSRKQNINYDIIDLAHMVIVNEKVDIKNLPNLLTSMSKFTIAKDYSEIANNNAIIELSKTDKITTLMYITTDTYKNVIDEQKLLLVTSLLGNSKFDTKINDLVTSIPAGMHSHYEPVFPVLSVIDKIRYRIELNAISEFNSEILTLFRNEYIAILNKYNKELEYLFGYITYLLSIRNTTTAGVSSNMSFCDGNISGNNNLLIYPSKYIDKGYSDIFTVTILDVLHITEPIAMDKYFRLVVIEGIKHVVLPVTESKSIKFDRYADAVNTALTITNAFVDTQIDILLKEIAADTCLKLVDKYETNNCDIVEYLKEITRYVVTDA